ncbi:CHC2 zinc finger domain-containing protein [Variovorax sp. J22R24]|uniref:CHC2 zinc finger domain-containing protein n=1 Tax=Variovorax gracilis TaxID=3053502 RepID=UPI00257541CF|nr:CHC2 zinc finger domain-containing protein [Variovorax sp. J22R24]MDM0108488.1 CHC2 zinc finger domain-containing protein [Variovorax sp. J22R24]
MPLIRDRLPEPQAYYESQDLALLGKGTWRTTRCAFHGGSDSMRVNLRNGAFVCMAGCGARGGDVLAYHMAAQGLGFVEAAKDLGAWEDDPQHEATRRPRRPSGLPARDALALLREDAMVVAIAAGNLAHGYPLSEADFERLREGAARIQRIADEVGVDARW